MPNGKVYEFGAFRLDPRERALFRSDQAIPLTPKALEMLVVLVANHGRIVDKRELLECVWPGTFVEEGNLNVNVFTLRKALGDTAEAHTYIETVPRRGFRFIAPVREIAGEPDGFILQKRVVTRVVTDEEVEEGEAPDSAVEPGSAQWHAPAPSRARRKAILAAAILAVLLAVGYVSGRWRALLHPSVPSQFQRVSFRQLTLPAHSVRWVATGDFNHDGKPDLVYSNNVANQITVALGKGDGTFTPVGSYSTGQGPGDPLVVGDLNNDGNLDVVVANWDQPALSVYLGNGDGTLRPVAPVKFGGKSKGIVLADFNGDGILDMAVCSSTLRKVQIFQGRGNGTFIHQADIATEGPADIVAADLDGDGHIDLAVTNFRTGLASTVSILMGNGDGSFRPPVNYSTGRAPLSIAIGDVNHDGKLDIVTANFVGGEDGLAVLLGYGDGTFHPAKFYPAGFGTGTVALVDLSGDGNLDLVALNLHSGTASILMGKGDGTFEPKIDVPVGKYPSILAVGDFNGDGRPDLAVATDLSDSIAILLNTSPKASRPSASIRGK